MKAGEDEVRQARYKQVREEQSASHYLRRYNYAFYELVREASADRGGWVAKRTLLYGSDIFYCRVL